LFGNFDCIIFGLEREFCLVILTVLYLDLRGSFVGNFDCIIFGLEREFCLVILTVLYLDLRGSLIW